MYTIIFYLLLFCVRPLVAMEESFQQDFHGNSYTIIKTGFFPNILKQNNIEVKNVNIIGQMHALYCAWLMLEEWENLYIKAPSVEDFKQWLLYAMGDEGDSRKKIDLIADGAVAKIYYSNLVQRTVCNRNMYLSHGVSDFFKVFTRINNKGFLSRSDFSKLCKDLVQRLVSGKRKSKFNTSTFLLNMGSKINKYNIFIGIKNNDHGSYDIIICDVFSRYSDACYRCLAVLLSQCLFDYEQKGSRYFSYEESINFLCTQIDLENLLMYK